MSYKNEYINVDVETLDKSKEHEVIRNFTVC